MNPTISTVASSPQTRPQKQNQAQPYRLSVAESVAARRPNHGADLAPYNVVRLGDLDGSWDAGGPDNLTFKDIATRCSTTYG